MQNILFLAPSLRPFQKYNKPRAAFSKPCLAQTRGKKREEKSAFNDLFLDACRRGFHGANRTGFLPVDLDATKNDFIQQEEFVRCFLFPLASRCSERKGFEIARVVGLFDDDDERLHSRTSLQQLIFRATIFFNSYNSYSSADHRRSLHPFLDICSS